LKHLGFILLFQSRETVPILPPYSHTITH
jgi:hypothetical protein